jgi:hypothetical protein
LTPCCCCYERSDLRKGRRGQLTEKKTLRKERKEELSLGEERRRLRALRRTSKGAMKEVFQER